MVIVAFGTIALCWDPFINLPQIGVLLSGGKQRATHKLQEKHGGDDTPFQQGMHPSYHRRLNYSARLKKF
jgi:hypothetical protein